MTEQVKDQGIISMSGGLDSTVLLAYLLDKGVSIRGAFAFGYPSKHNLYERAAVRKVASHYDVPLEYIETKGLFINFQSALLTSSDLPIPEGHYTDKTMKDTVVPARNMIFLSVLTGLADSLHCWAVYIGVHAGDHPIYPDCRPKFIEAIRDAAALATEGRVQIAAPFQSLTKSQIVQMGLSLNVPFELTRTCYQPQWGACGKCGACRERAEAFALCGVVDPLSSQPGITG